MHSILASNYLEACVALWIFFLFQKCFFRSCGCLAPYTIRHWLEIRLNGQITSYSNLSTWVWTPRTYIKSVTGWHNVPVSLRWRQAVSRGSWTASMVYIVVNTKTLCLRQGGNWRLTADVYLWLTHGHDSINMSTLTCFKTPTHTHPYVHTYVKVTKEMWVKRIWDL